MFHSDTEAGGEGGGWREVGGDQGCLVVGGGVSRSVGRLAASDVISRAPSSIHVGGSERLPERDKKRGAH